MSDETIYEDMLPVGVGETVPEFKMETFEPSTGQFGRLAWPISRLTANGRFWFFTRISPSCAPRS